MKILHVISPLTKGGAERVAVELANAFGRSGDEVTVLASAPTEPRLLQDRIDPAVEVRFVCSAPTPALSAYLSALKWVFDNREFIRSCDIVHGHLTFGSLFASFVVLLRWIAGARTPKVVETYHAVGTKMSPLKRRLHMLLAASHDGLVSMAEDSAIAKFRRGHPALPYAMIPNGVAFDGNPPSQEESAEYRRRLHIPKDALVIGTVGRIVPDRYPDRIVRIFAEIARKRDDVHFLMGGEGSEAATVARLANDLGLADRLSLPGIVLRPELPFSIMDLYVTLNVGPITGVAGMEAAAAELPVVALQLDPTYVPSGADWIFSSADPVAVADEAMRLLGHPEERDDLAKRQSAHVRREHGVDTMATSYRHFYASLLQ